MRIIIIAPSFEQRVSKLAYSLNGLNNYITVLAEERSVSSEFEEYINDIDYLQIPVNSKKKRLPIGRSRNHFLRNYIQSQLLSYNIITIITRDVLYSYLVGKIFNNCPRIKLVIDIADNYDLFYETLANHTKKYFFRLGFSYLTKKSLFYADGIVVVCPTNRDRLIKQYGKIIKGKQIVILRNLPLVENFRSKKKKIPRSIVYVGKIDEISRDPMYILHKMIILKQYSLHMYSTEKKETIEKMKKFVAKYHLEDRVVFHERVKYSLLHDEISQYEFGVIPHKRSGLTDYTLPNKLYDYKLAEVISIMSNNPSMVEENKLFNFGVIYDKEKDDFVDVMKQASNFSYLVSKQNLPTWEKEVLELNKLILRMGS